MSLTVFLDAGPLSLIASPKRTAEALAISRWAIGMIAGGHRLMVPAIADYEVRRELVRAGKARSVSALNDFNSAAPGRFVSLSDRALLLAAEYWARSRNSGQATADPKELNADVLIAAQATDFGVPAGEMVIATTNVGHLALFAPAANWREISP